MYVVGRQQQNDARQAELERVADERSQQLEVMRTQMMQMHEQMESDRVQASHDASAAMAQAYASGAQSVRATEAPSTSERGQPRDFPMRTSTSTSEKSAMSYLPELDKLGRTITTKPPAAVVSGRPNEGGPS